jgi:hypothetical protein
MCPVAKVADLWKSSCFYAAHIFIMMKKPAAANCDTMPMPLRIVPRRRGYQEKEQRQHPQALRGGALVVVDRLPHQLLPVHTNWVDPFSKVKVKTYSLLL